VAKKKKIDGTIINGIPTTSCTSKKRRNTVRQNQEEIKGLIIDEIIKRYQYQEGFINIL
jgi:carboxyl-terminal processing protease